MNSASVTRARTYIPADGQLLLARHDNVRIGFQPLHEPIRPLEAIRAYGNEEKYRSFQPFPGTLTTSHAQVCAVPCSSAIGFGASDRLHRVSWTSDIDDCTSVCAAHSQFTCGPPSLSRSRPKGRRPQHRFFLSQGCSTPQYRLYCRESYLTRFSGRPFGWSQIHKRIGRRAEVLGSRQAPSR